MPAVDVLVPVLWRPEHAARFMASLDQSGAGAGCQVTAIVTVLDDETRVAWEAQPAQVLVLPVSRRSFACKVNDAYRRTDAPWMLLVGDDVTFCPGWLDYALAAARERQADVIGTNDGGLQARAEMSPHPLIRRTYVDGRGASWDGPGVLAHEGYRHNYVDREILTVAQQRGRYAYAPLAKIEHLHHDGGRSPVDDTYRLGTASLELDKALWKQREAGHR